MKCAKCTQFDEETKAKMLSMFGSDEVAYLASRVIQDNHSSRSSLHFLKQKNNETLRRRAQTQTHIDFTGQIIGKFIIAMEPDHLTELTKQLKKNGIMLNIEHEACPHMMDEGEEIDASFAEVEGRADGVMEGDFCNRNGCAGVIKLSDVENCSCHLNAPCPPCTSQILRCSICDYEEPSQ